MGDTTIHCARQLEDMTTLCGVQGVVEAMDLFSRTWQSWRMRFPDQEACPECEALWRPVALEMEKKRFQRDAELGFF